MRFQFIAMVVAALLLYSCTVTAEGNERTSIFAPPREITETSALGEVDVQRVGERRSHPAISKTPGIPITPARTIHRRFMDTLIPKNAFTFTDGYFNAKRTKVRTSKESFATKKRRYARKFVNPDLDSDHPSTLQSRSRAALILEPVIHPKGNFFGPASALHSTMASRDMSGPLIGPLNFPGLGKNVYVRLLTPLDEESGSLHVTIRLVNGPEHPDFQPSRAVEPSFSPAAKFRSTKSPILGMLPPPLKPIYPHTGPSSFAGPRPPVESTSPPTLLRNPWLQDHRNVPRDLLDHPVPRLNNEPHYLAAPNHNQLPIVLRPVDNLIDLPIYPPLSTGKPQDEIEGGRDTKDPADVKSPSTDDKLDTDARAEENASAKHNFAARNYVITSPTANWRAKLTYRRESPEPVFMKEITAPDVSARHLAVVSVRRPRVIGRHGGLISLLDGGETKNAMTPITKVSDSGLQQSKKLRASAAPTSRSTLNVTPRTTPDHSWRYRTASTRDSEEHVTSKSEFRSNTTNTQTPSAASGPEEFEFKKIQT